MEIKRSERIPNYSNGRIEWKDKMANRNWKHNLSIVPIYR